MESESSETKGRSGADQSSAGDRARVPGGFWLIWLAAIGALLSAYWLQDRQLPCGDQFNPAATWTQSEFWRCPHETNPHNRQVGTIGNTALNSTWFDADGQRGWGVGYEGALLSTRDGGQSWQARASGTRVWLRSVVFSADGQRGWAVGDEGTVLSTRDGGQSWQAQASGTRAWLQSVVFNADGQRGWAVGDEGTVLSTRDGGQSWQAQASGTRASLLSVVFSTDGQRGWAVGSQGTVLSTRDGGQSWQAQASGTEAWLQSVMFSTDGQRGWAVGSQGTVLSTRDGGQSWQAQTSSTQASLLSVVFSVDGQHGWTVGSQGTVLSTRNGGKSWQAQASGTRASLRSVMFSADGQRGWAVGDEGTVLSTRDGGQSWQAQASGMRAWLQSVVFSADGQRGWAVGDEGRVLSTRDGGQSWQAQASGTQASLVSVVFSADGQRGWAVGDEGRVLSTRDGGQSWQAQASGTRAWLQSVVFNADGQRGWAVDDEGTVLSTRDGGKSWQAQASGTEASLLSVVFSADGQRGWAVGSQGTVLSTRDGGQSWQAQASGTRVRLLSVVFSTDGQRGWAVGTGGTVLSTRDGGQSWQAQTSGTQAWLQSVVFSTDGQRGWAVGTGGTVLSTRDGGQSWQAQASGTRASLKSVVFSADGQRGWAVGGGGTVLSTRDGGQSWQAQGLYQRYPTPWFALLSVLLLAGMALAAGRWMLRPATTRQERIVSRALADEPISRADQDRLGFTPIVEGLAAYLRHEKTRPSVVLAITAPWGRGKSSMMRMLRTQLERHRLPIVWFNAWHHQKEPVLMAALLSTVVQQSVPSWFSLDGLRFRSRLVWRRWWRRPLLGALPAMLWFGLLLALAVSAVTAVAMALGRAGVAGVNPVFQWWADRVHGALGWVTGNKAVESLTAGEWARFARELMVALGQDPAKSLPLLAVVMAMATVFFLFTYYARAFPANPSALLASLGGKFSLSQAEAQTGFRDRFREHFRDVTEALQPRTLTVFIDDLDRCEARNSAEVLEAVNYLTDSGQCFVVLGISRDIVEAQLGDAYDSLAQRTAEFEQVRAALATPLSASRQPEDDKDQQAADAQVAARVRLNYARNYLRKLIQIEVPVPAFDRAQAQAMVADDEDKTREAQQAQRRVLAVERQWQRLFDLRGIGSALLALLLPGLVIGWLVWQAGVWGDAKEKEFVSERSRVQEQARGAQQTLDAARRYAAFLRLDVAALMERSKAASAASAPSATPAASLASAAVPDPLLELARRQAQLTNAEALLADADRLVQRMQADIEERRPKAALEREPKINAKSGEVMALAKDDGHYQARLDAERQRSQAAAAQAAASAAGDERPRPPSKAGSSALAQEPPRPAWPLVTALLALLLPLVALLLRPRRQQIVESQDYRVASRDWSPVVASAPSQQAPRELVRFFNLSRYLAVRLHAAAYVPMPWLKRWLRKRAGLPVEDQVRRQVAESTIVALTSLYLVRPPAFRNGNAQRWLEHPLAVLRQMPHADPEDVLAAAIRLALPSLGSGDVDTWPFWTTQDVTTFLAACGEIRVDESPSRASTPATSAGT